MRLALGLDFGTESVRAVLADVADGRIVAAASQNYAHGVIDRTLPNDSHDLPLDYALQHPQDWLFQAATAVKKAVHAGGINPAAIIGIGVDFTSCTMLPCRADGTPLCLISQYRDRPLAWPKLWKHHGAKAETDRINAVAHDRKEPWLARYGGVIGLEWFFPKMLETLNGDARVYQAADLFLEAGDWFVWQLVSGPFPGCSTENLTRSTCQAGYKAQWSRREGYPSNAFFAAVQPRFGDCVHQKMSGEMIAPGRRAGVLTAAAGKLLGLPAGIPVSAAIIDAHAGVPGAGVGGAGQLVMVMGTSSCYLLNSRTEAFVPGLAGVVEDGILPGFFGYEGGQASVGDAFAWISRTLGRSHEELTKLAAALPPGSGGVLGIDWLNGCRTPLMDGRLSGAFVGLTLQTRPEQLYRAMLEATAFGFRRIVDSLRDSGVAVGRFVASGGLPGRSPLLMQIYADVLGSAISLAESDQSVALGAAILGAAAAGKQTSGHANMGSLIKAMARQRREPVYKPLAKNRAAYQQMYELYLRLAAGKGEIAATMRALRGATC